MFGKLAIFIVLCSLANSSVSNGHQIAHSSGNTDSTNPTLRVIGLGYSNVTFTWTRTGEWAAIGEKDFKVSLLPRDGAYRPIEFDYSFTQFWDFYYNSSTKQPNYVCNEEKCQCSFRGHIEDDTWGRGYKACSDGVIVVEGGELKLMANFTTAPQVNSLMSTEIDGNNLIVQFEGFNKSDVGICGRDILLNVYQPVENRGFYPWYWPGINHYGNIVHQRNLSMDSDNEGEYKFALDPKIPTNDVTTHSVAAVMAYIDGDTHIVTNTWFISDLYYEGAGSMASISAFTVILASLLSLFFN